MSRVDIQKARQERKQKHKEKLQDRQEEIMEGIHQELMKRDIENMDHMESGRTHLTLVNKEAKVRFTIGTSDMTTYYSPYKSDIKISIPDFNNGHKYFYEKKTDVLTRVEEIVDSIITRFENRVQRALYKSKEQSLREKAEAFRESIVDGEYSSYRGRVELNYPHSNLISVNVSVQHSKENEEKIIEFIDLMNAKLEEFGIAK